jgi:RNA polymerase sigma-70 factor (ECF subfamily)
LIRLVGDFDLAEDALHDAFTAALEQWERDGIPVNPRSWLISTGRFKAIDALRKRARQTATLADFAERAESLHFDAYDIDAPDVPDDQLRLIFTCCHPSLSPEARTALTLREVCGLTTDEIARAFLAAPTTVAQRIVRAKAKIRDARIPYQLPSRADLPDRLTVVLQIIYLVFNEGYSASSGEDLTRPSLSAEAIRLARLLLGLLPDPEAAGLLALMLLHESRRAARATPDGDIVLLDEQDRSLWNRTLISEGLGLLRGVLSGGRFGAYTLQAAIAAVHADAATAAATDWAKIVELYDALYHLSPSPVIELNRAAAIAMRDGPAAGLRLIDSLIDRGELLDYHLAHSARADLCRRLGRYGDSRVAYERALALTRQGPERRFIQTRLKALSP